MQPTAAIPDIRERDSAQLMRVALGQEKADDSLDGYIIRFFYFIHSHNPPLYHLLPGSSLQALNLLWQQQQRR